ncbi:MAG: UvrD-helicase domain-containing protein [Pirellulaceae bacterium]|nr:UvrD-helicase domain-containing protein [Pirellulaceae bacterium]
MNSSIKEQLDHPALENVVIRASAGTGKTFQLSNRYLQLVLAGHPVDRILATTFTRKAAGEILQRVMLRLANAASDEGKCRELAAQLGWQQLTTQQCRSVLRRITQQLHRLRIATLDAFFLQATQALSLELGLPPDWQIIDESEQQQMSDEAIANLLLDEQTDTVVQLMHWLTKGEARRGVHDLVRDTVSNVYELFLETTPACWSGVQRQTVLEERLLEETIQDVLSVEMKPSVKKAVERDLTNFANQDWDGFIKKGVAAKVAKGETKFNRTELPPELVQPYQRLVNHAVAELCNRIVSQTESTYELLQRYHQQYETLKFNRRSLLFGDLSRCLADFQRTGQMGNLAFRLDGSIESLLLDEFQDTSLYQWEVIRPFAAHAASADSSDRSFLCVGDQKQAIYGWRGGDAELLDAVNEELTHTTRGEPLNVSRRSSREVISVVNRINQNIDAHTNLLSGRAAVEGWCESFPEHKTVKEMEGRVVARTAPAAEDSEKQRDITLQYAAARVKEVANQAPTASIAILVRANESVGKLIYELHRLGVPASEEGGNPLVDSAAVQLILSLMRLGDHPSDSIARFHLSQSPWGRRLGLENYRDTEQAIRFSRTVRRELAENGFGNAVQRWAEQLQPWCNRREWRRLMQLVELACVYQDQLETPRVIGQQLQHRSANRCDGFVEWIESQKVADPSEDRVRVMTVHQSKGLQFDYVVLPDLDRLLTPTTPRCVVQRPKATENINLVCRYANADLRRHFSANVQQMFDDFFTQSTREQLCVMYVALTRAVHGLELIIAPSAANEKTIPATSAGLIRAAVNKQEPLSPETPFLEKGNEAWWKELSATSAVAQPVEQIVDCVQLAPRVTAMHRGFEVAQPSSLEGGGFVRLGNRLSLPSASAMQFGSLIHLFFEQVRWIDQDLPEQQALAELARQNDVDESHIEKALNSFREMIAQPQVTRLLSSSSYADQLAAGSGRRLEVKSEQTLSVSLGDTILSGAIDRLVITFERNRPVAADVIDYKTDAVKSAQEMQQRVDYYRPQLQAYGAGVQRMLRLPPEKVTARLLFLAPDKVVTIR